MFTVCQMFFFTLFSQRTAQSLAMPLNCKMTSPLDRLIAMRFEVVRLNSVANHAANSRNSYGAPKCGPVETRPLSIWLLW